MNTLARLRKLEDRFGKEYSKKYFFIKVYEDGKKFFQRENDTEVEIDNKEIEELHKQNPTSVFFHIQSFGVHEMSKDST